MTHPDWDYGARPPRDERAPDVRFTRSHPDGTEPPHGSVADTSSMEPSPEAIGWARQADEWAQPERAMRPAPERDVPGLRPSEWHPASAERAWPQPSNLADPSATVPNMPAPDRAIAGGPTRPVHPTESEPFRRPNVADRAGAWEEATQPRGWSTPGVYGTPWSEPAAADPRGAPGQRRSEDRQAGDQRRAEDRQAGEQWRPEDRQAGEQWRPENWQAGDQWRPEDPQAKDQWRAEPDSGGWSPDPVDWSADADRQNGWRTDPEPAPGGAPWRVGAEPWRRDTRPAADPWAQSAADSGVIPMSWEEPAADTGSWRSPAGWPAPRSPWDDGPTARVSDSWRERSHPWDEGLPAPGGTYLRPAESQPGPNDAVTEIRQSIDSDRWRRAGMPPAGPTPAPGHGPHGPHNQRGSATYLGGGGEWRHELAMRSDLEDGESRRYGTQDFRPARSADGTYASASGTANGYPVTGTPSAGLAGSLSAVGEDEAEGNGGGVLAAVGYTIIWYGVPVVLFVLYVLVFGSHDRAHALTTLAGAAPQFGLSLLISVVIAVGLRWLVGSWRAVSVGLAAAVLGGGLATVLVSAITGHSLT